MHTIDLVFHYGAQQRFLYGEDAVGATRDYDKVKAALEKYRQFKNDNLETVEIDGGSIGGKATLRIEHLMSVSITDWTKSKSDREDWARLLGEIDGVHAREKARSALT